MSTWTEKVATALSDVAPYWQRKEDIPDAQWSTLYQVTRNAGAEADRYRALLDELAAAVRAAEAARTLYNASGHIEPFLVRQRRALAAATLATLPPEPERNDR